MVRNSFASGLVALAAVLAACAKAAPKDVPIVEVQGECAEVFQGQVCTWARMQDTILIDVGATIPLASIENAPTTADMAWPPVALAKLALPAAAQKQAGLTEFTMFWEADGHPPAPYMTPHFDFHFYTVSPEEQEAIDCTDSSKPETLAAGYSLPDQPLPPDMAKMTGVKSLIGICVPQMGMHSLPTAELESKDVFRGDMVIGYYHGKNIFVEPMLTKAMLLEKKSFDLPIPDDTGADGGVPAYLACGLGSGEAGLSVCLLRIRTGELNRAAELGRRRPTGRRPRTIQDPPRSPSP